MKFIKSILATLVVSLAFSATAFAAGLNNETDYTFSLSVDKTSIQAGDTITVSVFLSAEDVDSIEIPIDNGGSLAIGLNYNKDVVTWGGQRTDVGTDTELTIRPAGVTTEDGNLTFQTMFDYGDEIGAITPTTALIKYTFKVNEGVLSATYGASNPLFELVSDTTSYLDSTSMQKTLKKTMGDCPTITVVGEEPTPTVEATKNNETGVITFTTPEENSEIADKYIVVNTAEIVDGSKVTENTRVKVTCNGKTKTFGNEMWEEAGFDGEGGIKTKKIAFGVVFTDSNLKASDFTFEIINLAE